MIYILIFSLCYLTAGALYISDYSFSAPVGRGSGNAFASKGEGRITGIRVWEIYGAYIRAIQLRYDYSWSPIFGRGTNDKQEMLLFDDEYIVQMSGKYSSSNYIYQLMFVTNRGRFLMAGQYSGSSFNFHAGYRQQELRMISGRADGNGITAIGAHWGVYRPAQEVPEHINRSLWPAGLAHN